MSWIRISWTWIIESIVLLSVLGLLLKIFVSNSKKIDIYIQKLWDSTRKSQAFLQQVDHEFDLMNKCAKSIKNVFLNFSRVYKDISKGTKTVEEAIREAKNNMPEELRNKFSRLFLLTEEPDSADEQIRNFSTSEFCFLRSKPFFSDDERYTTNPYISKGLDGESEIRNHDLLA